MGSIDHFVHVDLFVDLTLLTVIATFIIILSEWHGCISTEVVDAQNRDT